MLIVLPAEFHAYAEATRAALLREYTDWEIVFDGQAFSIATNGSNLDRDRIETIIFAAIYRERIYKETLGIRHRIYNG